MSAPWNVKYNGGALESFGLAISHGQFFFDPLALTTYGFIYGRGAPWFPIDDCEGVTWTPTTSGETVTWTKVDDCQ